MPYDFSRITERLFVGAQINSPDDVLEIKSRGITHIIDAQEEKNDNLPSDLAYLWDPTDDDGLIKPAKWFGSAIDFALGALGHPGFAVLAHCAAGVNRGPSLAYAILRSQGLARDVTWALLKQGRPQANVAYARDAEMALKQLGWCHD